MSALPIPPTVVSLYDAKTHLSELGERAAAGEEIVVTKHGKPRFRLVEMNEAFAAQVLPCRDEIGIDPNKLNVSGGAIALGHPFGMTGARITTTLLNGLRERDGQFGLETMCVGGGQGMAMIIERLS